MLIAVGRPCDRTGRSSYSSAYSLACLLPADRPHAWAFLNAASPMRERNVARTASSCATRGMYACSQPLPLVYRSERAAVSSRTARCGLSCWLATVARPSR
jgi:hypothetical protein